ncbi:MAG: 30S ribosomal protein S9 [bacterium]|jgi:small subunit ribosomal protein S9|nr:30S ribosomal protein S9 [bacterium]MBK9774857.1 30S ribosomal protein S9 [bacterium]
MIRVRTQATAAGWTGRNDTTKERELEERYYATGRRKTAVARVWLTQGTGKVRVNDRAVEEYFGEAVREQALRPLVTLGLQGDFDVWCTVKGGGISGQAGALRHGLARALVVANEDYRSPMRRGGYLTRDSRMVERKKYGQPGARKRFQFSKR